MEEHLKQVYGHDTFREFQKEIITDILNKDDVMVVLPTGGGKSLLYQFPTTYSNKTTIVISPLISLMNDQCIYLKSKNIRATSLNSETKVNVSEYKNYDVIYTTPEFIINRIPAFKLMKDQLGLIAVDEAHCASQWSHDFRTCYQKIYLLKQQLPTIPILAITATATPSVLKDIYKHIGLKNTCEYLLGTRRDNLSINVLPKSLFSKCKFDVPTIIYTSTRKVCEKLAAMLTRKNIPNAHYHGGMSKLKKDESHRQFINDEILVIVATISFGMGIDKPNIRHVINYGMPSDIETYYQEIGRAGRDKLPCKSTIYFDEGDMSTHSYLLSKGAESQLNIKMQRLNMLFSYLTEQSICRQQMIEYYFENERLPLESELDNTVCNMCDNCLSEKETIRNDITKEAKCIVNTINDFYMMKGFCVGLKKTIEMIQTSKKHIIEPARTDEWVKDVINILISKNILKRYKPPRSFGIVITVGNVRIVDASPIIGEIKMDESTIRNVFQSYTYNKPTKTPQPKKNKIKTRDMVKQLYKNGERPHDIAIKLQVSFQTINNHILNIMCSDEDVDIDFDYFDLDEETECKIKDAISEVGDAKLRPIKDIVGRNITYEQIKLCIIAMKFEEE
jgi:RecQ family ATP-dependent DNA helicase